MSYPSARRMLNELYLLLDFGWWEGMGHLRAVQLAVLATKVTGKRYRVVRQRKDYNQWAKWLVEREARP